jgi:hypothetical protein
MSNAWGGTTATLGYRGTQANQPPNYTFSKRDPNQFDTKNVSVGDFWMNQTTPSLWVLLKLAGTMNSEGMLATWSEVIMGANGTIDQINGDTGSAFPVAGIIDIIGSTYIETIASGNTLAIGIQGTTQHAIQVGAAAGSLNSLPLGTTGQILKSNGAGADPSWENESASGAVTQVNTDSGNVTPTAGVIEIIGGHSISTEGAGDVVAVSVSGTTNHCVQIGNALGAISSVANGTTGQVLTAQTGADPIWAAAGGGAFVLIQSQTAVTQAALNFTTGITPTYHSYEIVMDSVSDATSSNNFVQVQLSTNAGVSYINTGYRTGGSVTTGLRLFALTDGGSIGSGTSNLYNVTSGVGYVTCVSSDIVVIEPGASAFNSAEFSSYETAATTVNAFRIVMDDGSVFSGNFSLYGITH